jgi:Domain of unknown function (DUF4386)
MSTNPQPAPGALRWDIFGAATGLFFVVATIVGNEMAGSGNTAGDSAATALANIRRTHSLTNHLGLWLEILGFVAFMWFAGYLYRVLRRAEGPQDWLAAAALIAAAADLGIKLGSGATLVAANYHPAELTPDLAHLLVNLNDAAFIVAGLTMAAFVVTVAASAYGTRALPRTFAWIGLVIGVLGLATPILGFTDPKNYNPLPYLAALLWIAAVSIARIVVDARGRGSVTSQDETVAIGAAR